MFQQGAISVTAPTERCAGIVPVLKPNDSVRICVDLPHLNKAVQLCEIHPLLSVDENLARLGDSKIFSKLDANSGFWQIPLDDELKFLTTFLTPFGRFCFNRLTFGIISAGLSPSSVGIFVYTFSLLAYAFRFLIKLKNCNFKILKENSTITYLQIFHFEKLNIILNM